MKERNSERSAKRIRGSAVSTWKATVLALVALVFVVTPAQAQQSAGRQNNQNQQTRVQLDPEKWIWIGYDRNNDGMIDGYEYLSVYDLETARKSSRERMDLSSNGQSRGTRFQDQSQSPSYMQSRQSRETRQFSDSQQMSAQDRMQDRAARMDRLEGRIQSTRTVTLSQLNERHALAKVKTQDGTIARVDLGPQRQIKKLDLKKGDQVVLMGSGGKINDIPVFLAQRIQTDGRTLNIARAPGKEMHRYNAEVLNTRTASFSGKNLPDQQFARVRLENGRTTIVALGPASDMTGLNIQPGQKIAMLAHTADIQGKRALVADEVFAGGKLTAIKWSGSADAGGSAGGSGRTGSEAGSASGAGGRQQSTEQ